MPNASKFFLFPSCGRGILHFSIKNEIIDPAMRNVTRSFFIIWAVLSFLLFIVFIIIATSMSANQAEVIATLQERGMDLETAKQSVAMTLSVMFFFSFFFLADGIYSGILAALVTREGLKFPVRLVLSIFSILLLVLVPGILMLIDTIRTRNGVPEEEPKAPEESA